MTLLHNYGGSKQKSSGMTQMQTFVTEDKAKPNTEKFKRLKVVGGQD